MDPKEAEQYEAFKERSKQRRREREAAHDKLLENLKTHLPVLEKLLEEVDLEFGLEDHVYRFYHGSFKIYWAQRTTEEIVSALKLLAPIGFPLSNKLFLEVIAAGTGKTFRMEHNQRWATETRPIVEALFHARYMLGMAARYGRELQTPPTTLPSGYASLLHLYGLR